MNTPKDHPGIHPAFPIIRNDPAFLNPGRRSFKNASAFLPRRAWCEAPSSLRGCDPPEAFISVGGSLRSGTPVSEKTPEMEGTAEAIPFWLLRFLLCFCFPKTFFFDRSLSVSAFSRLISFSDVLSHRHSSSCRDSCSHRSASRKYRNARASPGPTSDRPRSRSCAQRNCAEAYAV